MRTRILPNLVLVAASAAWSPVVAQSAAPRTYANPVDLDYRYSLPREGEGRSFRSGADPVIVRQGEDYYLFVTRSGGWWHSKDLADWQFVEPSLWPEDGIVAPAALSVRDTLYLMASATSPHPIYFSTSPSSGALEIYNPALASPPGMLTVTEEQAEPGPTPGAIPPGPWDPDIFHDPDTDRWYLYWGSSNYYPVYGVSLDKSRRLATGDSVRALFALDPDRHGWERFGENHTDPRAPFVEGSWMTKHGGRYYLQYAAPGTEYNVYANGTYVGDAPLGPFEYAPYNPVAYKPGGWLTGAGHGNTFQDAHGNWWNTGTGWIGINWHFERRVVMHPAGFDEDGQMYVDTRFGDFPHWIPDRLWSDSSTFTGWMLLSYRKPARATSALDTFPASNLTDEDPRTFWVAEQNAAGEGVMLDLEHARMVRAVQVDFVDYRSDIFAGDSTSAARFRILASMDRVQWTTIADLSHETRDRANPYIELREPMRARWIRYEHIRSPTAYLAISDIRVFGNGDGPPPPAPAHVDARRDADPRNAFVTWDEVPGAVGYNVLWGIAPDRLHETYQRFADQPQPLEIRALTVGQDYWFAVEAFDENGVSTTTGPVHVPAAAGR